MLFGREELFAGEIIKDGSLLDALHHLARNRGQGDWTIIICAYLVALLEDGDHVGLLEELRGAAFIVRTAEDGDKRWRHDVSALLEDTRVHSIWAWGLVRGHRLQA